MAVKRLEFVSLVTFGCYFWQSPLSCFSPASESIGIELAIKRTYFYLSVLADYRSCDTFATYLREQPPFQFVFGS